MFGTVALSLILAQSDLQSGQSFPLWKDTPYAKGTSANDIPTLTPFLPEKKSNTAIVVCPGGGYYMLADHEGHDYAEFLAMHGITAFVLRYRLGQFGYRHPAMLADAQRAVRTVRSMGFKTVGLMGSSAGGHLTGTACVHYDFPAYEAKDDIDKISARPDFGVLCYAVLTFNAPYGHTGSRDNLIGPDAPKELMHFMDLPSQVTKDTPPCFIWSTTEDTVVPSQNSEMFADALRDHKVPYELHIFQKGGHGIGLTVKAPYTNPHPWATDLLFWLKANNWNN
ncbi:MAG: prolyl oligopeptidase family serine peptidase [Armatimonadetes bacterium]|nr:prolyl oligopeptidase family serine peptidase [Armatimonadota bacterium]MBS1728262.1 alpha/beta hydrolase [Armatimonadota bacterium]